MLYFLLGVLAGFCLGCFLCRHLVKASKKQLDSARELHDKVDCERKNALELYDRLQKTGARTEACLKELEDVHEKCKAYFEYEDRI